MLDILKAYTLFFGRESWFVDLKESRQKNPLFGYYDWDFESIQSYKYLDFLEATIGITKLKSFLFFDIVGRRYICPTCLFEMTRNNDYMKSKWAFLMPNDTFSCTVYCINCNNDNEVERIDCNIGDCKGNVMTMDGICLSCGEQQI